MPKYIFLLQQKTSNDQFSVSVDMPFAILSRAQLFDFLKIPPTPPPEGDHHPFDIGAGTAGGGGVSWTPFPNWVQASMVNTPDGRFFSVWQYKVLDPIAGAPGATGGKRYRKTRKTRK